MVKSRIIKTKRLLIKPFSARYLTKRYISWLNDPKVILYSRHRHKRHSLASCRKYLASFKKSPNYFLSILLANNKLTHIGNITVFIDRDNLVADLGILIGERKDWGKGYATEACKAVCRFLFEEKCIRKITAGALSVNKSMLKVMKRIGMVEDGRRKKHILWQNKEVDVIYGAIFRTEILNENG